MRIAPDVVDRGLTPVAAPGCAIGKDGGLNPAPVEIGNVEDAARVKQIPGRLAIDERHQLAGHHLVKVEDRDIEGAGSAQIDRIHARGAEQRLTRHVVDIDFHGRGAAERRAISRDPLAAGMVVGLPADGVALSRQQPIERRIDLGSVGLHRLAIQGADVVQVYIDREAIELQVEDVQRCAALQHQAVGQHRIAGDLLEQVHEPQDLLQRPGRQAGFPGEALQGLGGWSGHGCPSKDGLRTASGRITRHPEATLPAPGRAPRA